MQYRVLGLSGLRVSAIGFGAWGIGGPTAGATSYGPTDDRRSLAALAAALDHGITFFDTAPAYGDGHSEALLGQALKGRRDQVVIASKLGQPRFDAPADLSAAGMRAQIEGSLRRLATDHLDLVQLHSPDPAALLADPGIVETVAGFVRQGLARSWGISAKAPADALVAIERFQAPVVQVNLNLMDRRALESGLLDRCAAAGVGVIARTPLSFGFLAGRLDADAVFPPQDHRSRWSRAQIARWVEGCRLFVAGLADREGQSAAQIALRFCLSHPAVATTIPGMMAPAEVAENAAAGARGPLPPEDLQAIARLAEGQDFFVRG